MTGETPMFEYAADGELFDTRPFSDSDPVADRMERDGITEDEAIASLACPACGRPTRGRQGSECERCEDAGHMAPRLAHDLGTIPVPTDRKG